MSLTQKVIPTITTAGSYQDKHGLFLRVDKSGAKRWLLRYQLNGERHDAGLGAFPAVSLAEARRLSVDMRALIQKGVDPLAKKVEDMRQARTFEEEALARIDRYKAGWSDKHTDQWINSMHEHVFPKIGKMPVRDVDTDAVLKVLEPIWDDKNETARRVRNRIELILNYAKTRGFREGENPARWRGHLNNVLSRTKLASVPLEAMPYAQLPAFMSLLEADDSRAARCLQFLILTGARTSEAMLARWDEIDYEQRLWSVPAERMKNGKPHEVPLTEAALNVLKDTHTRGRSDLIFPNRYLVKEMASNSLRRLLAKYEESCTAHGFRATFSTWAEEETMFPPDLVETALSHTTKTTTARAYARGNQIEKRRPLMEKWAQFVTERVVPLRPIRAVKNKTKGKNSSQSYGMSL